MKHVLLIPLLGCACQGTEQSRRTFPLSVGAVHALTTTDSGWTVAVSQAKVSLVAGRFFSGKVLLSRRRSPLDLLIRSAWAHPGHYQQGEALAEILTPIAVDLLATETAWGEVNGVTGEYGSMQLTYAPAGITIAGTASKAGVDVLFQASFAPPAPLEGIKFDYVIGKTAGSALASIDFNVVLSRVDFSQTGASASPLDTTSVAFNGFARGVEDTTAYSVTWREQ